MKKYQVTIGGNKLDTENYVEVLNPSTEEIVGLSPECSDEQVDLAVSEARQAFKSWSAEDDAVRAKTLHAMADAIEANAEELASLLTQEQGKPVKVMGSEFEVGGCVGWLRATAEMSLPVKTLEDSDERTALLYRKPIGVVASLTPWNWPLMIAIWHLAPAIRVGCTVVLKPASNTPLSTLRMIEVLNEALPKGVLNVVAGSAGYKLSSHEGIDKVIFTGSTPVGKGVMASAAPSLKRLTLELGGNDAGIVLPDANIAELAEGLFWGAFINNGQTCAALKRLYVHDSLYDQVCEALTAIATNVKTGDGFDEETVFGPVQNKKQQQFVAELVEDAKANGGRVLCGGEMPEGKGFFYPITLVADVTDGMRIVDEEQFGPVLPIIRYSDVDEVVERANKSDMGLGGSVWSSDMALAQQVAQRVESGTVWINGHGQVMPHIPFGGVKQSGVGVEFGIEGLEEYTTVQSMVIPK